MVMIKLKLKEIWTKYQLIILIALASIIVSIMAIFIYKFFVKPKISLKHYNNSVYTVNYDSTWKLSQKEQNKLTLKHNNAIINIEITTLDNDYLYMSLENIVDEILYVIKKDNPNYYLIAKEPSSVTINQYDGYQLLYEDGENEVLLTLFRKENKIVSIVYEAPYEDFDILLDSVKDIIYNFKLNSQEYNIDYDFIEIEGENLYLYGNSEIEINGIKNYQIADNHYQVDFQVPGNFSTKTFNSRYSFLNYDGLTEGNITLTANIYEYNLYEILSEFKTRSFDYSIKNATKNGELLKETYTKINADQYIYHAMYNDNNSSYDVVYLIYELDYRRVFVIKLLAQNCNLSQEIIENIGIVNSIKYADYVHRNIEDGKLVNEMKYAYTDKQDYLRKFSQVTLYTPSDYRELDDGFSNVYESRTFNNNFNEDSGVYDFEVRYSINSLNINSNLNTLESVYYNKNNRNSLGVKTYNNKKFQVYTYNNKKNYVYVLFHKLESGNYLQIVIESKGIKINNRKLIELTKFDENIYEMN